MIKIVVIGGSYAFDEISEIINDINIYEKKYQIVGVLDDDFTLREKYSEQFDTTGSLSDAQFLPSDIKFVFGVGSFRNRLKREGIFAKLNLNEDRFETIIHPTAKVFSNSKIGIGCIVHYGTVIYSGTHIEPFTVISANCVIGVNNLIGKFALFGSNVTTTTGVKIGPLAFVGSSSSFDENIEIGPGALIGMTSFVQRNIAAGLSAMGNPIKIYNKEEIEINTLSYWQNLKNKFIKEQLWKIRF